MALAVSWGLAARLLLALFFISMPGALDLTAPIPGFVGKVQSESLLHVQAAEAFLRQGTYPSEGRSLGYAAALVPLRAVLSRATTANVLVLLQVLVAGLAVYALSLLAVEAFGHGTAPVLCLVLFGVSTYTTTWDVFLLPASLGTSALVFGALLHARALRDRTPTLLLGSGALFAWAVFLIPTILGAFVSSLVVLLVATARTERVGDRPLRSGALFALPVVLAGGVWGYCRAMPQTGPSSAESAAQATPGLEEALNDFLRAWGGSVVHWDPRAEINWFEMRAPQNFRLPTQSDTPPFPSYIYTTAFGPADLVAIKVSIREFLDQERPLTARTQAGEHARARLESYRASVRLEKPFVYFVVAPLHLLSRFLLHSGTYNLFSRPVADLDRLEFVFKASMTLLYWYVLLFGVVGVTLALARGGREPVVVSLAVTTLYLGLVYPIGMRHDEARHFVPAYPFVLLFACDSAARLGASLRSSLSWSVRRTER